MGVYESIYAEDHLPKRIAVASRNYVCTSLSPFGVVGRVGFEPTTNGLKGRCSTTELPTQPMGRVKLNNASGWRKADFPLAG